MTIPVSGRLEPQVISTASTATLTPNFNNGTFWIITAQAAGLSIANPTNATQGMPFTLRIKDNGTARAITWGSQYRAADGLTLPSTTVVGKTHVISGFYNSTDTKADVMAIGTLT